jgi:hypothetical protein
VPFRRLIQTIFMPCWGLDRSNSSNGQCHLPIYLAIRSAAAEICPQNLASFGVRTTITYIFSMGR